MESTTYLGIWRKFISLLDHSPGQFELTRCLKGPRGTSRLHRHGVPTATSMDDLEAEVGVRARVGDGRGRGPPRGGDVRDDDGNALGQVQVAATVILIPAAREP